MPMGLQFVQLKGGITTTRESWLEELTRSEAPEELEGEKATEYAVAIAAHIRALGSQRLVLRHVREQPTRERAGLAQTFEALAAQWLEETKYLSDPVRQFLHPLHFKIIAMGEEILPLVLREVERGSGHWFVVLNAISPENPASIEDETNFARLTDVWLKWGKGKGLI